MFLQGTPLEESEIWRNEGISGSADLTALLKNRAGLRAEFVGLESIRANVESLAVTLARRAAAGVEAVVCDAETEDDLRAIAHAAAKLSQPAVFAGSAGLARHLPQAFGLTRNRESPTKLESVRSAIEKRASRTPGHSHPISRSVAASHAPLLFVVGSTSQVSREQLRRLTEESEVRALNLSPMTLRDGAGSILWRDAFRLLDEALSRNEDVALALGVGEGVDLGESAFLTGALAQFVLPFVRSFGGLFCTGGETARALLNATGAVGIRLVCEVEPGVPLGTVEGWHNLPIVTKAGAFGSPQTLLRCRAALHRFLNSTNSALNNLTS
jgi:uncharacterized protein YgbK (DUF1537 family)